MEQIGQLVHQLPALFRECFGYPPSDNFNAAYPGGNAALAGDAEAADLSGAVYVGSPTKFHTQPFLFAKTNHAYFVAILLAKERHRAFFNRAAITCPTDVDGIVVQHNGIGATLHLCQFIISHWLRMG